MVGTQLIKDSPSLGLRIPNVARLLAFVFAALVFYGGLRTILFTGELPLIWPVLAALLSITFLFGVSRVKDSVVGLARFGFHIGLFAYFLSLPILFPAEIEPGFPDEVHQTIGWMLILVILGFEAGYKLKAFFWRAKAPTEQAMSFRPQQRRVVALLIFLGLVIWLVATIDYSLAADVSLWDILLAMRRQIEGAIESPTTKLGIWSYLFTGGLYLATAAAFVLLNHINLKRSNRFHLNTIVICWAVLVLCCVLGFLSGSRALFLYSFAPLVLALWVRLSIAHLGKALRLIAVSVAGVALIAAWLAISTMRGRDADTYQESFQTIQPLEAARGAFDIYSSSAIIIQAFPEKLDYEYGRSLVPLVLGWLPRSLWPDKPYPFSIYANSIQGETLEYRSASIAVGLPGEGYGNFGLFGVFLWGLLMGFACRVADDYLKRFHASDPLRLFLGASVCIWAAMIVRGGVAEMFYMGLQVNIFPIALSVILKTMENRSGWAIATRFFGSNRLLAPDKSLGSDAV